MKKIITFLFVFYSLIIYCQKNDDLKKIMDEIKKAEEIGDTIIYIKLMN